MASNPTIDRDGRNVENSPTADGDKKAPSSLTIKQISGYAMNETQPEAGMCVIDWLLWFMLRDIYRDYKTGNMAKEDCAARKDRAIQIWLEAWEREGLNNAIVAKANEIISQQIGQGVETV